MRLKETMSMGCKAGRLKSIGGVLALACLTGCSGFFPPLNGGGGTGGGTTTGDYVYVANSFTSSVSGTNSAYSITGFAVGTNALTAITGATQTLQIPPQAMVVTPSNSFLYVVASGVVYGYAIGSGGVLTQVLNANGGQVLANANMVSMVVSPDGQWLLGVDVNQAVAQVDEFQIGSTGLLTLETGAQHALTSGRTIVASNIAVSPLGDYIAVSLGTGGLYEFSLATSTGLITPVAELFAPTTSSASQAAVFDAKSATIYVAVSGTNGGVYPYTIGSGGGLTLVSGAPFSLGTGTTTAGPASILIDKSSKYLYVGNRAAGSVSGYSIATGGVLTALTGSPYTAGTTVTALGYDKSGSYILAAASGGSPDLQLYSFDSTNAGMLDSAATALTGDGVEPAGAVALAVTH